MIVAEIPNLFDQYSQHENRVTDALLQVLACSPNLLRSFLLEFLGVRIVGSRDKVVISAQKQMQGVGDRPGADPAAEERDSIRAKTLLKVLMQTIRPDVLEMYPALTGGRPGITLDRPMVWDCFGVEPQFTADLHLTFSIREDETVIGLTLPNAAGQRWRRLRAILEDPNLSTQLQKALTQLRRQVPELWMRLDQRHFIGMRKIVPDALLEFRVDTAPFARPARGVRPFPIWFATAREALLHKGGANLQFMVRAVFNHAHVPAVKSPRFAHTALRTLRHFQSLYDLLRASEATPAGKQRRR